MAFVGRPIGISAKLAESDTRSLSLNIFLDLALEGFDAGVLYGEGSQVIVWDQLDRGVFPVILLGDLQDLDLPAAPFYRDQSRYSPGDGLVLGICRNSGGGSGRVKHPSTQIFGRNKPATSLAEPLTAGVTRATISAREHRFVGPVRNLATHQNPDLVELLQVPIQVRRELILRARGENRGRPAHYG